jgi:hypothetical protein
MRSNSTVDKVQVLATRFSLLERAYELLPNLGHKFCKTLARQFTLPIQNSA